MDLDHLQKYRENNRIEAKKATGGLPGSLWETYSAFANTSGGVILLGVEEKKDKTLNPIFLPDPEKLVSEFWATIANRQKISANILKADDVQIAEAGGKQIIVISVPRAGRLDKPVCIGMNPFTDSYRRNGEGDYHCTPDEVRSMLRDQADESQDMRPLETMGLEAFSVASVADYREAYDGAAVKAAGEPIKTASQTDMPTKAASMIEAASGKTAGADLTAEEIDFLISIGGAARTEDGEIRPTRAGLLMLGDERYIIREFPNYILDYRENSESDDKNSWTCRFTSADGDWSGNLYDFYQKVGKRMTDPVTGEPDEEAREAIMAALANALIHSDYYGRRGIIVRRWTGEVVIDNPGGLRMTPDEAIEGGVSDPRNAMLIRLFNGIGVGARAGTGVPLIFSLWEKRGWQTPRLHESYEPERTHIRMVMKKRDDKYKKVTIKSDSQKAAITEFLWENDFGRTADFAELLKVGPTRVKKLVHELESEGIVTARGGNRNRVYILTKKEH